LTVYNLLNSVNFGLNQLNFRNIVQYLGRVPISLNLVNLANLLQAAQYCAILRVPSS